MIYKTRDFGEININESDIIEFIVSPFGFDMCKKFALIHDEKIGSNIVWLQSLEEPDVCFILFDPSFLSSYYIPNLPEEDIKILGDGELLCWVIGVIPGDIKNATINLKSPIIINTKNNKAMQLILDENYPIKYPLMKGDDL